MAPRRRKYYTRASIRKDAERIREAATRPMVTRSAARAAARDPAVYAVFHTSELMEMILLRVPMKDLLLSQRVSQRWREVIQKTRSLQRILFMKREWPISRWDYTSSTDPFYMYKTLTRSVRKGSEHPGPVFAGVIYNLLFLRKIDGLGDMAVFGREIVPAAVHLRFDLLQSQTGGSNGEESWRRMYLTQPPWPGFIFVLPTLAVGNVVRIPQVKHDLAPSSKGRHVASLMEFYHQPLSAIGWENIIIATKRDVLLLSEKQTRMEKLMEVYALFNGTTRIIMVEKVTMST